ncbi:unnamed protein product [Pedinophyceae sp. YPF-701]|nr:unnamed protein product [Pedinophyceae sp. YPF-701]
MAFLRVDPRTVFSNMQQQERTRMDAMMPGIEDFPGMCALDALAASQHEARHNVELGMQLGASAPGVLPGFGAPQVPADAGPADDAARVAGVKREAPAAKHGFVAKALHAAEARDVAVAPAAKRPRCVLLACAGAAFARGGGSCVRLRVPRLARLTHSVRACGAGRGRGSWRRTRWWGWRPTCRTSR